MHSLDFDVVIVGGGVIGLACAVYACAPGRSVLLLERNARCGQETSSRNSGVVHAGLYYPSASLKARTCVAGRKLLYARCARHAIAHRRCGKLLVATRAEQCARLEALHVLGTENGAGELRLVDAAELARLEPRVRGVAALLSPETGIVDVHGLMDSYRADAQDGGAQLLVGTRVTAIERTGDHFRVETLDAGGTQQSLSCAWVVNAAGLESDRIAQLAGIDVRAAGLSLHYCKGDYFSISSSLGPLCDHLVYPVPGDAGLGIHLTFDLGGQLSAGPDAEYVEGVDYAIDPAKAARFASAVARYMPQVQPQHLRPNYAGIRPKLQGPGQGFRDFVVQEASDLGVPGLINLIGIESPGLTASEAIALEVAELLAGHRPTGSAALR